MRLDREDVEVLATWGIRAGVVLISIPLIAATLGIAWRVFDLLKG